MTENRRYSLIDAIRAFAIINMILFHLCYDIFVVFGVWKKFPFAVPAIIWERCICFTFIIVSGISMNYSHHGYRRGIIVNLCGLLITAVTLWMTPDQPIWFGILNFLGCAMIITFALRRPLCRMEPLLGMIIFFLLFAFFYRIPQRSLGFFSIPLIRLPDALYESVWLVPLGFMPKGFFSADYFPFLKWIFLYLFGYQLWRFIEQKGLDRLFYRRIPVLDFIGRHSLIIYMAHQPLLYGICYLFFQ